MRVTSSRGLGGGAGGAHVRAIGGQAIGGAVSVGGELTVGLLGKGAAQVPEMSNCQRRLPGTLLHWGGRSPAGGRLLTLLRKPYCPEYHAIQKSVHFVFLFVAGLELEFCHVLVAFS